jgi:hypothetical protein
LFIQAQFFNWFTAPIRQAAVKRQWTLEKKFFKDPTDSSQQTPFPSLLEDDASKTLSIIVPAYNEVSISPENFLK